MENYKKESKDKKLEKETNMKISPETKIKIFTGQKEDQNKIKENKIQQLENKKKKNIKPKNKLLGEHPSVPLNLFLEAKKSIREGYNGQDFL